MNLLIRATEELMPPQDLAELIIKDQLSDTGRHWQPHSPLRVLIQPFVNVFVTPVIRMLGLNAKSMNPDRAVIFRYNRKKQKAELLTSQVLSTAVGWEELLARIDMVGGRYGFDFNESDLKKTLDELAERTFRNTLAIVEDDPRKILMFAKINLEMEKILSRLRKSWESLPVTLFKEKNLPLTAVERRIGAKLLQKMGVDKDAGRALYLAIKHNWHMRRCLDYGHFRYDLYREIHEQAGPHEILIGSVHESEILDTFGLHTDGAYGLSDDEMHAILNGLTPAVMQLLALAMMGTPARLLSHPDRDEIFLPGLSIIAKTLLNPP